MTLSHFERRARRLGLAGLNPNQGGRPSHPQGEVRIPGGLALADVLFQWDARNPTVNGATGEAMPFTAGVTGASMEHYRRDVGGVPVCEFQTGNTRGGNSNGLGPLRWFGYNANWGADSIQLDANLPYTIYWVAAARAAAAVYAFSYGNTATDRLSAITRPASSLGNAVLVQGAGGNDQDYSTESPAVDELIAGASTVTATEITSYTNGLGDGSTATTNTSGVIAGATVAAIFVGALVASGGSECAVGYVLIAKGAYDPKIDAWVRENHGVGVSAADELPGLANILGDLNPQYIVTDGVGVDAHTALAWSAGSEGHQITADGAYDLALNTFPYSFGHQAGAFDYSAQLPFTTYMVLEPSAYDLVGGTASYWSRYAGATARIWMQFDTNGEVATRVTGTAGYSTRSTTGAAIGIGERVVIACEWTSLTARKTYVNGVLLGDHTVTSNDLGSNAGGYAHGFVFGLGYTPTGKLFRSVDMSGAYSAEVNSYLTARYLATKVTEDDPTSSLFDFNPAESVTVDQGTSGIAILEGGTGITYPDSDGFPSALFDGTNGLYTASSPFSNLTDLTDGVTFYLVSKRTDVGTDNQSTCGVDRVSGDAQRDAIGITMIGGTNACVIYSADDAAGEYDSNGVHARDEVAITACHVSAYYLQAWVDEQLNSGKTTVAAGPHDPSGLDRVTIGCNGYWITSATDPWAIGSHIGPIHRFIIREGRPEEAVLGYLRRTYIKPILADLNPQNGGDDGYTDPTAGAAVWTSGTAMALSTPDDGDAILSGDGAAANALKVGTSPFTDHSADVPFTVYVAYTPRGADISGQECLFSFRDAANPSWRAYGRFLAAGEMRITTQDAVSTSNVSTSGAGLVVDQTYVFAFEFTSLTEQSIYVDGVKTTGTVTSRDCGDISWLYIGQLAAASNFVQGDYKRLLVVDGAFDRSLNAALAIRYQGLKKPAAPVYPHSPSRPPDSVLDASAIRLLWDPALNPERDELNGIDISVVGVPTPTTRLGLPAISFAGVGDYYAGSFSLGTLAATHTAYVVHEPVGAGAYEPLAGFMQLADYANENMGIGARGTSTAFGGFGAKESLAVGGGNDYAGISITAGTIHLHTVEFTTTTVEAWTDGVSTAGATANLALPLLMDYFQIGNYAGVGGATGNIFLLMLVEGGRDTAIEAWITAKYRIGQSP